jgi:hypothetical protein
MKSPLPLLLIAAATALPPALLPPAARAQVAQAPSPVVVADFTNPGVSPSHWLITLHRDGNGHFHSDRGDPPPTETKEIDVPVIDRDIQVSASFADHVFQTAQQHNWFNEECESHMKVAFQGWKKISYSGPEAEGTCTFNYSKDKDIQALGDALMGVAETMLEGARLEMLLQHDRLGLDKEMEFLVEASKDGRLREICTIREILAKVEGDPEVLDRVRKKARVLLAHSGS